MQVTAAGYAHMRDGGTIDLPLGWRLLAEGQRVPHVHREFIQWDSHHGVWASARHCTSTMTPIYACVWGNVRAFAIPVEGKNNG